MQLLATAMDTNDTRSIISTLPQQQVIYLPVDQDAPGPAAGPSGGQQQANASAVSALLMHKLGATALASAGGATEDPAAVLPLQAALPYGGGTASAQSTGQSGNAAGDSSLPAGPRDTGAQPDTVAAASRAQGGAAGTLLPTQAQQVYPELSLEAHNMTGADLHQSKVALEQQKETGAIQPG